MRIPLSGLILIVAAVGAGAQSTRASVGPASKLWIEGTSNIHDWKCEASTFEAIIDIDAAGITAAPSRLVKKVSVKIPVKDLKCGKGKMDDNLRKALNANVHPDIKYTLSSIQVTPGEAKDAFIFSAVGVLFVAGTENSVTMDIAATRLADGTIKATGTLPVKMTAYGVKPPKAMFGTIKTGDEVKVRFDLVVGPKVVALIDK